MHLVEKNMAQRGRKAEIDLDALEQLAMLNPSRDEIAAFFRVSKRTVYNHLKKKDFAEAVERGRNHRKTSLKRAQWKSAMDGNVAMQIWLGKNELGQTDRPQNAEATPEELADAVTDAIRFAMKNTKAKKPEEDTDNADPLTQPPPEEEAPTDPPEKKPARKKAPAKKKATVKK